ncbi:UvrD-like helicase C-terminal domain-containing protein [Variovorax sp. PDC80]|jgi:hypothetical protein|uniref:ATP-dependent DNA helicase n=1 Tax=Variovorax sp. PDC80 TaxID=1882827 RepID=UPI0008E0788E|nr:AAA family ATPase [Variovorax sp. PDC80]SFO71674.1 UvrD-like helicase C-terminal domain-containing protein [Variovorax sp. PDC80]
MHEISLTPSQATALQRLKDFLRGDSSCFLLRGSAGTGKTTMVSALLAHLDASQRPHASLAPTGRAARILGARTGSAAGTLHRGIYRLETVEVFEDAQTRNDPGIRFLYPLRTDDPADTVFIVDESSMVGDKAAEGDVLRFGSGRLLADLVEFARLSRPGRDPARGARIVFVGDPAQLAPVGDNRSPALSSDYLRETFGLRCESHELTEVMRQSSGSAILERATALRDAIARQDFNAFDLAEAGDGAAREIRHLPLAEALDHVAQAFRSRANSVLVTGTNAMALELNRAVRARLWGDEHAAPRAGDLLMVNRNAPMAQLMNGDLVKLLAADAEPEVRQVPIRGETQPVALRFRRMTMAYRNGDGAVVQVEEVVLENLLESRDRELSPLELRALLVDFRQRHPQLQPKSAEFRATIRQDPYFNAVQVKYGYAVTCHKAQGGEWDTVVVHFPDANAGRNEAFFRWAYTAITRARGSLLLVDPPRFSRLGIDFGEAVAAPPPVTGAQAEAPDPQDDPDWDRYSFNPGQELLFAHHLRLRAALSAAGVGIVRQQHAQYCQKYWLERGGARAALQYFYKGDQRVGSIVAMPGAPCDAALLSECLEAVQRALSVAPQAAPDAFLDDFRRELERAVAADGLRILSAEPGSYRLRITFEGDGRRGQVDFHYDGKKRWTRATEVGGPGGSRGIFQQVSGAVDAAR